MYFGSISSFNLMDIFCLHIFLLILSYCLIDFIHKLQIFEALHIRNMQTKLNRINFQTSANVLRRLLLLKLFIEQF